jgi:hypothetical protein
MKNLVKFLLLLLAASAHASNNKGYGGGTPKPLHEWDFRQDCSGGKKKKSPIIGAEDRGSASDKAPGAFLGGASCANNRAGVSIDTQPGNCGGACESDQQYVNIESLGEWGGNDWSFEAYFRFDTLFSGPLQRVFDFSGPNTQTGQQNNNVMLNTNGGTGVKFEVWNAATAYRCDISSGFFVAGDWIHVVVTVGDGFERKIYKDGALVTWSCDTGLAAIPVAVRNSNFIGKSSFYYAVYCPNTYCGVYENFDGVIAFIRIYDKELNDTTVTQLYNARNRYAY